MLHSSKPTTVAIVEDTPEFLNYFSELVRQYEGFQLVGTASTGAEGIALAESCAADVFLIDLGLPDISGIEVIRHVREKRPEAEVMVISVFGDDENVVASIEAGATGYLLKDSSKEEIREAIHALRDGGSPITPSIARRLLRRFIEAGAKLARPAEAEHNHEQKDIDASGLLTGREVEILRLLAKGLSYGEISKSLGISSHTAARHVKNTYRKLAVSSRGEAVYEASKMGIIKF